jgi:hypothetical protein
MRLFVPLTKTEFDTLKELARTERRRPQDQAAAMLAQVLAVESDESHLSGDTTIDDTPRQAPDGASSRGTLDVRT